MDFREGKDIIGHFDDLFCRERQRDVHLYQNDGARAKPSLVLRDLAFIEHYFFDKIAILTKLVAKI